jgi:uroporphyrinogen-III synthase
LKIKNILVSQPEPNDKEKSPYNDLVKKYGVNITFRKFITIEGIPAKEFRKDRINLLDYSAVVFNSRNSVDHYFRMAKEMRVEVPDSMKYFCVSESTAYYLTKYVQFRKRKIFHCKENYENLAELVKKHKAEKFLIPCSDVHKQEIPKLLHEQKVTYREAVIYRTVPNDLTGTDPSQFDLVLFFSPSGIKSLFKNFPDFRQDHALVGTFGTSTAKAAKEAGLRVDIPAPTATAPSMTMAIDQYLAHQSKKK